MHGNIGEVKRNGMNNWTWKKDGKSGEGIIIVLVHRKVYGFNRGASLKWFNDEMT